MDSFVKLIVQVFRVVPVMLFHPNYAFIFWTLTLLVFFQYRRCANLEKRIYGVTKNQTQAQVLSALGYGLLGGLVGSILLVSIGISLSSSGIIYVWPLAIVLMLINPRFMCFAYAGGLVSLASLAFGWPDIHVPGLMGLVAVLHMTESFLIWISGDSCATPLFIKNKRGEVVGGYVLQKFWPIPIAVLVLMAVPDISALEGLIQMPEWWPLIRPDRGIMESGNLVFAMVPVAAALGYSDIAITMPPREKASRSAMTLAAYSLLLLFFSILASRTAPFKWVAALFAPTGHEMVIHLGIRREVIAPSYYSQPERGLRVLGVLPDSASWRAGIRPGDILFEVAGFQIKNRDELRNALFFAFDRVFIIYESIEDGAIRQVWVKKDPDGYLGLVTAPEPGDSQHIEIGQSMLMSGALGRRIARCLGLQR